jgi:hypothetical protein
VPTVAGSGVSLQDERGLIERILQFEVDGTDHTGVEIDRLLAGVVGDLGYSEENVSRLHSKTGRSVFGNEGDWAKAKMTEERLHKWWAQPRIGRGAP